MNPHRQISASKTALLLQCARPFALDVEQDEREVGEAATYGSAIHECVAAMILKGEDTLPNNGKDIARVWDVENHLEMLSHAQRTYKALIRWAAKEKLKIVGVEQSTALDLRRGLMKATRLIQLDLNEHKYKGLNPGEIAGTYDILLEDGKQNSVVLDIKTGNTGEFHKPEALPQMLTLALMEGANRVAILHSVKDAPPIVYEGDISIAAETAHLDNLRAQMARIGDGSLRPGPECTYCPAKSTCPSQDGEMLVHAASLVRSAGEVLSKDTVSRGQLHMFLQEFDRLAKRARGLLRDEVRAGAIIQRPDGKVLALSKVKVESLSKASIERALGKEKGTAMVEQLRKLGCVDTREDERLTAANE